MSGHPETLKEVGRAQHGVAARMIIDLATAQVRNARELGRHAAGMGLDEAENPFTRVLGHEALRDAWTAGYRG